MQILCEQSDSTKKDVVSVYPVLLFHRGGKLAYKRLGRLVKEKGSTRADDHALLTAGQHHVRATLNSKETRFLRADDRDDNVVILIP